MAKQMQGVVNGSSHECETKREGDSMNAAKGERHDGQTVALLGHRVVNKLLVLAALGLGVDRFPFVRQDNCCVSEFQRVDNGYVICRLNDTAHLPRPDKDG